MTHSLSQHTEKLAATNNREATAHLATLTAEELTGLISDCQQVIEEETVRTTATNERPSWAACSHQQLIDQATSVLARHQDNKKESTP